MASIWQYKPHYGLGFVPTQPVAELMELDNFTFTPKMGGSAQLQSGEIINGTAGQVTISGDRNKFVQGTSSASSNSGVSPQEKYASNHLLVVLL